MSSMTAVSSTRATNSNRGLPKGTFQQGGTTVSTTSPASRFKTTDFYAQPRTVAVFRNKYVRLRLSGASTIWVND